MRVHPLAPVVGVDIDGSLGDYHSHIIWFLNNIYYPNGYGFRGLYADWSKTSTGEFSEALEMDKADYRAAKLAYRLGGLKRCMPIFQGDYRKDGRDAVKSEIQYIRSQGIQVWICTQRPWLSLTTVDPDTQYWIEHNIGKVDGLIYGEDKYADLVDIVGKDRILGVVEDLPENIEQARQLGLETAIRNGDHNQWWIDEQHKREVGGMDYWNTQHFTRIKDMSTIVDGWMENYNV